jgi:anti-sigma B factor antagonist
VFETPRIFVRLVGRRFSVQVLEHLYSNVVVLELTERLTVETEADLKDAVRRQLDAGRRHLVLDLARVPYVDSCGLGTMVQAYVSAHRAGGWVKLRNVTPRVHHLLTITRLTTVFEFFQPGMRAVGA